MGEGHQSGLFYAAFMANSCDRDGNNGRKSPDDASVRRAWRWPRWTDGTGGDGLAVDEAVDLILCDP